jgi:DNA replication and repair protein RecF
LELITNSPSTRREYLDSVLVQVDREYRRSLLVYQKGLRQRNRLLFLIREEKASQQQLFFWDKLLIKNGNIITQKRQRYLDFLNSHLDIFADLEVYYDLSGISIERLEKYKEEELAAGVTLVGPHRDDFITYQRKNQELRSIHSFGSRGEQRLAVLSLKLCELDFIEQETRERPILLLDDIFSELDEKHRQMVLKIIPKQQTIITTTDINFIKEYSGEIGIISLDEV